MSHATCLDLLRVLMCVFTNSILVLVIIRDTKRKKFHHQIIEQKVCQIVRQHSAY